MPIIKYKWKKYDYEVLQPGMFIKTNTNKVLFVGDNFNNINNVEYYCDDFIGLIKALKNKFEQLK